jgi:hypothetical protein
VQKKLIVLSLIFLASSTIAQEGYSAKSLFFGEDDSVIVAPTGVKTPSSQSLVKTQPEAKKAGASIAYKKPTGRTQIGASYFIRLKNNDGSTRDVLASRKFRSGERFQLGVKVNHPTYVYILNEGPDGKLAQIYPPPGQDNFINAMGTVFLPGKGSFEFDGIPGTEQLLVYLSPTPVNDKVSDRVRNTSPDVISASGEALSRSDHILCAEGASDTMQVASADSGYASKGILFKDDSVAACGNAKAQSESYASKGILFSDDPEPTGGGQVASYVVKNTDRADKSLYLKIKLNHE